MIVVKLVVINDKLIGQSLAIPIYNTNGILYMNKGLVLDISSLSRIKKMGISTLYIDDGNNECSLQEVISPVNKIKFIKMLNDEFNKIKVSKVPNYEPFYKIAKGLVENVNLSENAFLFNNIGKMDDKLNLAIHSIDVAILSLMVGVHKKYDISKLTNLCIGALLHDVGKIFVHGDDHVKLGYKIAKSNSMFSPTITVTIAQHHERYDGKGFPDNTKGDKIYEFSKIVSICDEYANYTSNEEGYLPLEIMEKLLAETNSKFDPAIFDDFKGSVYCYPNGLRVQLTNGLCGTVIMQNKDFPLRPLIQIDKKPNKEYVNLMKELSLQISNVLIEA